MIKNIITLFLSVFAISFVDAQAIKNGLVLNLPFNDDFNDYSGNALNGVIDNSISNSSYNPYLENFNEHTNLVCQSPCNGLCSDTNTTYPYNCWTKAYSEMSSKSNVYVSSYESVIDFTNSFTISIWVKFYTNSEHTGRPIQGSIFTTKYDNSGRAGDIDHLSPV